MRAGSFARFVRPALASAGIFLSAVSAVSAADELRALHWRSIGPAIAGGRVAAVAGTDADPFLYYFGAAGGGVWRTTNGGATWDDVFARQPVASIGALAIAASDKHIVWVGTGESKPRNDVSLGDGVWKSVDGGANWRHVGVESPSIARILVGRHDSNLVLVGALGTPYRDSSDRGVFRSTDGGVTWRKTLYVGPSSGASDLAWDGSGKLVFAGIWQFRRMPWTFSSGGPDDGLYRSKDGGVTWRKLTGYGLPSGLIGRIGVAVAPSDPRVVYALIQSAEGTLWRSSDGGDRWHLVNTDTYINQRPFYMSRLAVDPRDPNHVYFLSEDLVESTDGGRTIHTLDSQTHQDHHDMWIAADGRRMIEANDGGAPISLDAGHTWDFRANVSISQIYHLGYDMAIPYRVCGGIQDNDSYCGPSDSLSPLGILNHDWHDVGSDSDGSWTWPDPRDANLIWNVGVRDLNGQLTIFDERSRQSYDVTPYVRDTNGAAIAGLPYRFNWQAPVAFSVLDPTVAYFGGNVIWQTHDRGRHWRRISPDLTRNDPAHQLAAGGPINTDVSGAEFYDTLLDIAPSPLAAGVIWAASDDGLVHVTRDGGAHWADVTMAMAPYGRVECVEASGHDAASAFVAVDRRLSGDESPYLFATTDFGTTWRSISGDLPPDEALHVVRQDPRNPDVLYAGGEHGVWVSVNGGAHWQSLSLNMPAVSVRDLRVQPRDDDLIAATHGRGFWILDDLTPLQGLSAARQAGERLFQPRTARTFFQWWKYEYGYGGPGGPTCCAPQNQFAGDNPPEGAILDFYLSKAERTQPRLVIYDASGRAVAHLQAPNAAGINRAVWDLTEDAPVLWRSARSWNQGPGGLLVVPGTYSAALRLDGRTLVCTISVKPDSRAPWTQADYEERHAFLSELYDEVSQIDIALNELDRLRPLFAARLASLSRAHRSQASVARIRALMGKATAVSSELSSSPRNSEDPLLKPDKLRERLLILIDVYAALSQGPPLAAHREEAGEIKPIYVKAMADYRSFQRAVIAAGL